MIQVKTRAYMAIWTLGLSRVGKSKVDSNCPKFKSPESSKVEKSIVAIFTNNISKCVQLHQVIRLHDTK